jgi:leucyl-tRNA synthetase
MEYNFQDIEKKWKQYWEKNQVYRVTNESDKPKCYVLDMFPYPSGAGLHVGHPLGYIASDIYARYKRLKGYNVLHPMGFDAFGLPAEQYALETGQHPADTTEKNIARYREQLDNIGFCYDWSREVRTSDPKYYKWTQWIFLQLFHSWYNRTAQKAEPISKLVSIFELEGNINHTCPGDDKIDFDGEQWKQYSPTEQRAILMHYRLAYQGHAQVWWCEALGTVLANDEVVNGVSERGGHPVERKMMRQWFLRITEYADRLITSLDKLEWSDAMKEMQRNWIGKSSGAEVNFALPMSANAAEGNSSIKVFTTRPDTIFGVDFLVLAPEHELVDTITTTEQKKAVDEYRQYVKSRSERERMSEVKQVTGCFTGAYAVHPLNQNLLPVWIAEYVLAGYGTGAIMAVPSGDERDHAFAKNFEIPVTNIFGEKYTGENAYSEKIGTIENSGYLSGMSIAEAAETAIDTLVKIEAGKRRVNYRLRDAGFSRQRYWGEPFPIVYVNDVPYGVDENNATEVLPVTLPHVDSYKPGPEGKGPLANLEDWVQSAAGERETNTMPGYAGSSWYFLRYMDPHNDTEFAGRAATDYWQQVDLYVGGTEHAVGHLLYSRMWTKALYDLGHIGFDEPFKKLLNQGMIQGSSRFVFEVTVNKLVTNRRGRIFVSKSQYINLKKIENDILKTIEFLNEIGIDSVSVENIREDSKISIIRHHVDVNLVDGVLLNIPLFKELFNINTDSGYLLTEDDGTYICDAEVEKMSKSKYNVVNPDKIVEQYGADTFRLYEMFLGPVDVSKPWDTKGIEGVHRFLKKLWRLYADEQSGWIINYDAPTEGELRILHKTIKKVHEDIERFSFNTSVSQFMICVNELTSLGCHKRAILEPLTILLTAFAPHIAEELWQEGLQNKTTVLDASFPDYDEQLIAESSITYGVSVNGKKRTEMSFAATAEQAEVETAVLADATVQKWMEDKPLKKFIFVKGKMINVVV